MTTIFEKIIKKELPAEIVFENDKVIAIKDIHPVAPVHILIITKKVIPNLQSVNQEDLPLITEVIRVAQELAKKFNIQDGYRLLTNNGKNSGQAVFHLHFHLIGGRKLASMG